MPLTRIDVYKRAAPIILANATVPLLAVADTAVMGYFGTTQELAALALINTLFNMMFWGFGFLRMSTTGFIAQASGEKETEKLQILLLRALFIAAVGALTLWLLQTPILFFALNLFHTNDSMNSLISDYFWVRILGAPATLMLYCVHGTLIGLGKSKWLLFLQTLLNVINITLNLVLVLYFQLGLKGLALGTIIAEYLTLISGLLLIDRAFFPILKNRSGNLWLSIFTYAEWLRFFTTNRDIFIRTLFLLLGFFWFTNASAHYGELTLAGNQILLTVISFSAFFLDGFAYVAEAEVGRAYGLKQSFKLKQSVKITTEAAAVCALTLSVCIYLFDHKLVMLFTNKADVIAEVCRYSTYVAIYVALSFAAFQLDGIFIGATAAKSMRNASIVSFVCFIASYYPLTYIYARDGLWLSFIAFVVYRAIALGCYYPKLLQSAYAKQSIP